MVIANAHFICWLSHGGVDTVLSNDALLQHQCCCLRSSHGFFLGQSQSLMPVFLTMLWFLFFCCTMTQVWHSHAEESNSHENRFHSIDGSHNHKHISSLLCSTDNISCLSLFLLTVTQALLWCASQVTFDEFTHCLIVLQDFGTTFLCLSGNIYG
jgi:hypothetical protein